MGAPRLNRRRYLEVVRMLKEAVADKRVGWARRLRAGQLLLDVYERHDRAIERKEAAARSLAQPVAQPAKVEVVESHLDAEAAALLYLKSIKAIGGDGHENED